MIPRDAFPSPAPVERELSRADLEGRVRRDLRELAHLRTYLDGRVAFSTHDPLSGSLALLYAVEISAARAAVVAVMDRLGDLVAGAAHHGLRAVEVRDGGEVVPFDPQAFEAGLLGERLPAGHHPPARRLHDGENGADDGLVVGQLDEHTEHHGEPSGSKGSAA